MSIATYTSCVTILEKQVEIGTDSNKQKKLVTKAYCFETDKTDEQWWFSVFAHEKNLFFLANLNNENVVFPISYIISATPTLETTIDPTVDESKLDQSSTSQQVHSSALITLNAKFSPELQIFKDFSILLAKGNTKALTTFIDKYSLTTIIGIIFKAILCQGECYIQYDNNEILAEILQAKKPLSEPMTFRGEITFIPSELILKEFFTEVEQLEKETAAAKTQAQ